MDSPTLSIELDKASQRKVVNGRYTLLQTIGQGQFGKVLLAQDREKSQYVAIKTIHRVDTARLITKTYLSHSTKIRREIRIMKECSHPNVVKLYQVIDDMKFDKILLVLEYCQLGEIDWKRYNHYHEKYLKPQGKNLLLNKILRDVANGLEYLHLQKNIIHRDLKPSNLLISSDRTIKISDFGVSLILENNANDDKELGKTMGTPAFFAPELCQFVNNRLSSFNENDLRHSKIDARIDLWSLGVVLYCLFFHTLPFDGCNEFDLFKNIVQGDLKYPGTRQSSLASAADLAEVGHLKNLISSLLSKNPENRPSIHEIKAHPFTTFDLSRADAEKYRDSNKTVAESSLSQKLRRLFISRTEPKAEPKPPSPEPKDMRFRDLEHVDDLLDSYLDDSSSFGSVEEVDTASVLESIEMERSMRESERLEIEKKEAEKKQEAERSDKRESEKRGLEKKGPKKEPKADTRQKVDAKETETKTNGQKADRRPAPLSLPAQKAVVTIGPDSPSSAKSVFSPSRRFFNRFRKKEPAVTLTELSTSSGGYSDLAPPPTFGQWEPPSRNSISSMDSGGGSRKNSISSGISGSLSKISSSSSSLNLHAYLMDSPPSSWKNASLESSRNPQSGKNNSRSDSIRDRSSDIDSDSTDEADRTMTMDEYLDRLD